MLQAFAKPDLALAQKYQVQHLSRPHWGQPSFSLSFTVAGSPCGSVIHTETALLKKNSFFSNPPFYYSSLLTFLTIPYYLLTTYPSTLISSMQVSNDIRYKYSSFRCFYTFKFEGVNKLLLVFSSFSPGNFSTLLSNWVSKLGKHYLFPSLFVPSSKSANFVLLKLSCCCTLRTSFLKDFAVKNCCICCFPIW